MRVAILGIDALEFTSAVNYPDLHQVECRKVDNNIGIPDPGTPKLWSTISTGVKAPENGITGNQYRKKALKVPNWFDKVPGSIALHFPHENISWFPQGRMTRAMGKPAAMRAFAEECWQQLEERQEQWLEALDKKAPLTAIHLWSPDFIGHMYSWSEEMMKRLYDWCAETARLSREKIGDDGVLLIMSDHGMLTRARGGRVVIPGHPERSRGYHTKYSFFSSSIPIGFPEQPHITDIFQVVLDLVGMPTPSENEMLKERLKKLGYLDVVE